VVGGKRDLEQHLESFFKKLVQFIVRVLGKKVTKADGENKSALS